MLGAVEYDNYAKEQNLSGRILEIGAGVPPQPSIPIQYPAADSLCCSPLACIPRASSSSSKVIPVATTARVPQNRLGGRSCYYGYSPVAIVFRNNRWWFKAPIVAVILGFRRFRSHMPLAGRSVVPQSSAAMSSHDNSS